MSKRKRKNNQGLDSGNSTKAIFWGAPAIFAVWYAFILAKSLPGSWKIFYQGLTFILLKPWANSQTVTSALTLFLEGTLDCMMVLVIAVAAYGIGMPIIRRLFAAPASRLEKALLAEGIGLGVYSIAVLALGIIGVPPEAAVYSAAGAGIGLNAYELVLRLQSAPPKTSPEAPNFFSTLEPLEWAALAAIVYAAFLHLIGALGPETFYDSLVYHLAVPNLYIQKGAIVPIPKILHANFPQNMEMLYLSCLILRGETAAKLIHLWMGGLSCLALYEFARTACSRRTALIAVALFSSIPVVSIAVWHSGVELGVTFWSLMGAWSLVRGLFTLSNPTQRRELAPRWLVVSGAFFGFAMGAKYTAIWPTMAAAAVLAVQLFRVNNLERGLSVRLVLIWTVAAVSALTPWLLKNSLFIGNPVYPFLGSFFKDPYSAVNIAGFEASARGQYWHGGLLSWKTWLLMPWDMFVRGRNSFSFIGPILLAFTPLVLLFRRAAFPFGALLAMFGLQYVFWASTSSMIRLLIPGLPLFCLYAAHCLTRLGKNWRPWAPWLAFPIIAWNLSWNAAMLNETGVPGVVFGYETASSYRARPQHSYHYPYADAVLWIDDNIPADAKILLSGDSRSYPIPRDVSAASVFNPDPLLAFVKHAASPEELFSRLKTLGYTHLMIGHGEAYRNRGKDLRSINPDRLRVLSFFLQAYAKPLFRNAYGVAIYELRNPTEPVMPAKSLQEQPELIRLAIAHGAQL